MMNRPKKIYKYEPFTSQSLQNLKAQSLYFGSPLGFNDPYDCALKAAIQVPSDKELQEFKISYSQRSDVPKEIQNEFISASLDKLRAIVIKSAESILSQRTDNFLKTKGVTCFSERNNDLLMWSHYGGRYKGFCLEFSTEYEPFTKMRKVKYSNTMPKVNAVSALLNDNFDQMLDLFFTKSSSWSYEKEWRSIHNNEGTLYSYEAEALKSVYFGPDIDMQSLEIVCLILAGQNSDVKLWRGKRSSENFEVIFENFKYTSHIDAKRSGQIT